MSNFQRNLILLLKENKVDQTDLAKHLGISQQSISRYVNGVTEPRANHIIKIAKFFKISTDELLGVRA